MIGYIKLSERNHYNSLYSLTHTMFRYMTHNFIKYDYLIKGGTHFMTLNQSKEIETIIIENLL